MLCNVCTPLLLFADSAAQQVDQNLRHGLCTTRRFHGHDGEHSKVLQGILCAGGSHSDSASVALISIPMKIHPPTY